MFSALDLLKEKLEQEPAAASILEASFPVRLVNGQAHAPGLQCPDHPLAPAISSTLGEVFNYDYSHNCLTRARFCIPGGMSETAGSFVELLDQLAELPHFDDFINTTPSQETCELFLGLITRQFSMAGNKVTTTPAVMEWLHANKGYPVDPREMMDVYLDTLRGSNETHILEVAFDYGPYLGLDPEAALNMEALTEHCQKQEASPVRVLVPISDLTDYEATPTRKWHFTITHLATRRYKVPGTDLLALPVYLATLASKTCALLSDSTQRLIVDELPSNETLLTMSGLSRAGMDMNAAYLAATALD